MGYYLSCAKIWILSLVSILLLAGFTNGQDCDKDVNANYTRLNDTCSTTAEGEVCNYEKVCNIGYHEADPAILKCDVTGLGERNWTTVDVPCEECSSPSFGDKCSSIANCSSASYCLYDNVVGCKVDNSSNPVWAECDLEKMVISVPSTRMSGSIGVTDYVLLTASVNVDEKDIVEVSVTFNGTKEIINSTCQDSESLFGPIYCYQVLVDHSSEGNYTLEATTNYSESSKVVYLTIYDPASIITVYNQDGTPLDASTNIVVNPGDKSVVWTCEAEGDPTPNLIWKYSGVNVSTAKVGDRIYQNKTSGSLYFRPEKGILSSDSGGYSCFALNNDGTNTYVDVRAFNLIVGESVASQAEYATRQDFLIAVCIIGAALILLIIAFILAFLYMKKRLVKFKNIDDHRPSSPNSYAPDHHPPRNKGSSFDDLNHSRPSSPQNTLPDPAYMRSRPKPSLPKGAQNPRRGTQYEPPPPVQPRDIPKLPGVSTHRPQGYTNPPGRSVHHGAHRNPSYQPDPGHYAPTTYDEPEASHIYDDTAPDDDGTYADTMT